MLVGEFQFLYAEAVGRSPMDCRNDIMLSVLCSGQIHLLILLLLATFMGTEWLDDRSVICGREVCVCI
jgi:hypothetical protein